MNECGEVKVNKQVLVFFSIGKYNDEVWCDVAPMNASHLSLGCLWLFDRRVVHDRFRNRYSLDGKSITIVLLSLKQVYEDQLKLNREREAKGSENHGEIVSFEQRKKSNSVKRE